MPSTRIATGLWATGIEGELIEAVQIALVEALKIPEWDRDVVLELYDAKHRCVPAGQSERFTRVEVQMFVGRSKEAKQRLYKALVDHLAQVGVPISEIKTVLIEVPAENWGIRGGQAASEVSLGFKVDV